LTRWICHRGFAYGVAENSLQAFQKAVAAGVTVLETDLRSTKDNKILLCHDDDLARVTGKPIKIEEVEYKNLASLRLHDGQPIMTFDDLVTEFSTTGWIFDLKPPFVERTALALRAWAEVHQSYEWLVSNVRYLFWSKRDQKIFLRYFPDVECLARREQCYRAGLAALSSLPFGHGIVTGRTYSLPPRFMGVSLFEKKMVSYYHEKGAKVIAYLPERDDDVRKAFNAGFDEIISNYIPSD